jgi:hypothetical protein
MKKPLLGITLVMTVDGRIQEGMLFKHSMHRKTKKRLEASTRSGGELPDINELINMEEFHSLVQSDSVEEILVRMIPVIQGESKKRGDKTQVMDAFSGGFLKEVRHFKLVNFDSQCGNGGYALLNYRRHRAGGIGQRAQS